MIGRCLFPSVSSSSPEQITIDDVDVGDVTVIAARAMRRAAGGSGRGSERRGPTDTSKSTFMITIAVQCRPVLTLPCLILLLRCLILLLRCLLLQLPPAAVAAAVLLCCCCSVDGTAEDAAAGAADYARADCQSAAYRLEARGNLPLSVTL
jgi:hypothetical protein